MGFLNFQTNPYSSTLSKHGEKNTSAFEDSVQLVNSQKNDDVMRFETLLDGC